MALLGKLLCLLGYHDWRESIESSWGEEIKTRRCEKCLRKQRLFVNRQKTAQKWINVVR